MQVRQDYLALVLGTLLATLAAVSFTGSPLGCRYSQCFPTGQPVNHFLDTGCVLHTQPKLL